MSWIKNLFKAKKTPEQVKQWLIEENEKRQKEQQQKIEQADKTLTQQKQDLKQALDKFQNTELRNPNIPEKAKHYMQGNREQYIKQTNNFVEQITIPKQKEDYEHLNTLFKQYIEDTKRATTILNDFLKDNIKEIKHEIAKIEQNILELKKQEDAKQKLNKIFSLLDELDEIKEKQQQTQQQKEQLNQHIAQLNIQIDEQKNKKEQLTQTPEYKQIKEELLNAAKERQETEQELTKLFEPLTETIKKYSEKTKQLKKYTENPIDALIHDYTLNIVKHAQMLKNELSLDNTAAIDALKEFTRDKLSKKIHSYANAKKKEAQIHNQITHTKTMDEYEKIAQQTEELKKQITQKEEEQNKLQIPTTDQTKQELTKELEEYNILLI